MIDLDEDDPHPRCPECGCFMQVIEHRGPGDHDDDWRIVFRCNNRRYTHGEGD